VREADGLAMSSRNAYLTPAERKAAIVLYRALEAARQAFTGGEPDAGRLRAVMSDVLSGEPLARPVYVSVADPQTLQELAGPVDRALLSMAVQIGKPVLIDNMVIGEQ
jgi:pantoate--beta-alanine ligase